MRTHSQAPINQDPCACLLGHWFPRQAVYLSCPGRVCVCVCVCVCVLSVLWLTFGSRVVLS